MFKGLDTIYGPSDIQKNTGKEVTLKKSEFQVNLILNGPRHVHFFFLVVKWVKVMGIYWQSCSSKNVNLVCVFIAMVVVALVPNSPVTFSKKSGIFVWERKGSYHNKISLNISCCDFCVLQQLG